MLFYPSGLFCYINCMHVLSLIEKMCIMHLSGEINIENKHLSDKKCAFKRMN